MSDLERKLPVTILTGFLGSGKTTLLNHLLTAQTGRRAAVLVNDFGEIGIDHDLVTPVGDHIVELSNGCICCTINGDLLSAAQSILALAERLDYILVETTGLADPLPIALTFLRTELRARTRLDAVITVVDAENFSLTFFESASAAAAQIIHGDVVILNKADLVSEARLADLEESIRVRKKAPRILRATRGRVPLSAVLDLALREDFVAPIGRDKGGRSGLRGHLAGDGFVSVSLRFQRPLSASRFQQFLDDGLPEGVFRAKGILWLEGSPGRHVFHLSGRRATFEQDEWRGEPETKIVFIGQTLDREEIESRVEWCLT